MTFRLLVGLPSFNEADTIAKVTTDIDAALQSLPFEVDALLFNCDNASDDGTAEVFSSTATRYPKHSIQTEYAAGKGTNTLAILREAVAMDFHALISIDTDLAEVPDLWVHALVTALRGGAQYCYPIRPPRWNGGDLTYQLAYPILAAGFGVDLREPLCGDVALSNRAAREVLSEDWSAGDLRFGGDFLIASVAAERRWEPLSLPAKRRNKLRSFSGATDDEYRMGGKFRENALSVRQRVGLRIAAGPAPDRLQPFPVRTPPAQGAAVPLRDPDIDRLASGTSTRMRVDFDEHGFDMLPEPLAANLRDFAGSDPARGISWPVWRDCLTTWLRPTSSDKAPFSVDLLETLFLSRVVGHHREIAGSHDWYRTVVDQAHDMFAHRHKLWPSA